MSKKEKLEETVKVRITKENKKDLEEICKIHGLTESQAMRVALNVYISRFKYW